MIYIYAIDLYLSIHGGFTMYHIARCSMIYRRVHRCFKATLKNIVACPAGMAAPAEVDGKPRKKWGGWV
jgi:hypothetical protein